MGKRQRKRLRQRGQKQAGAPAIVTEVPYDSAQWMAYGVPTYGGQPMEPLRPSREEYIRAWNERDRPE